MNRTNLIKCSASALLALAQAQPAGAAGFLYNAVNGVNSPPGTPNEVQVKITGPTSLGIQFHNTATGSGECVRFEFSTKVNGRLVAPADNPATPYPDSCVFGTAQYLLRPLANLQPETEYCFQIWSRKTGNDIRSERPSAWACGTTPPHPPLAPLDIKAFTTSVAASSRPRLSWSAPDQSNHRGIASFTIERQTSPGPNRPWVDEGSVPGPAGSQSNTTQLTFAYTTSVIDPKLPQIYRVCAQNGGGRTCAAPVALEVRAPEIATKGVSLNDPIASASASPPQHPFSQLSPQAKASVLAAITSDSTAARPTAPRPAQAPSSATSPASTTASATPNSPPVPTPSPQHKVTIAAAMPAPSPAPGSGSTSGGGGGGGGMSGPRATATPAPTPGGADIGALVRTADLPRHLAKLEDSAIIIVGGKQARAGDVKQSVLALDDNAIIIVGGRRLEAHKLKKELKEHRGRPGNWDGVPGNKEALNPQPLPPSAAGQSATSSPFAAPGSALPK